MVAIGVGVYGRTLQDGGGRWTSKSGEGKLHLCAPPRIYPDELNVVPGTSWLCLTCRREWMSDGVQFVFDKYPVSPAGNDRLIGPMRWLLKHPHIEAFPGEQDLYDFRPAIVIIMRDVVPALSDLVQQLVRAMGGILR